MALDSVRRQVNFNPRTTQRHIVMNSDDAVRWNWMELRGTVKHNQTEIPLSGKMTSHDTRLYPAVLQDIAEYFQLRPGGLSLPCGLEQGGLFMHNYIAFDPAAILHELTYDQIALDVAAMLFQPLHNMAAIPIVVLLTWAVICVQLTRDTAVHSFGIRCSGMVLRHRSHSGGTSRQSRTALSGMTL